MLLLFVAVVYLFLHFFSICEEAESWPEYCIDVKNAI